MLRAIYNSLMKIGYENKYQPLAPTPVFISRLLYNTFIGVLVIVVSLFIGIVGYHITAKLSWIDAFYNASMILTGMGPAAQMTTDSAKWFSSLYAIFSGVVFITNIGFVLAPIVHRFLHSLHVESDDDKES